MIDSYIKRKVKAYRGLVIMLALGSVVCLAGVVNIFLGISNVFASGEPADFGRLFSGEVGGGTIGGFLMLVLFFAAMLIATFVGLVVYLRVRRNPYKKYITVYGTSISDVKTLITNIDKELMISKGVDKRTQNLQLFLGRSYIVCQVSKGVCIIPADRVHWAYPSTRMKDGKEVCKMHFFCHMYDGVPDKVAVPMPNSKGLEQLQKTLGTRYKFVVGKNDVLAKLYRTDYNSFVKECLRLRK